MTCVGKGGRYGRGQRSEVEEEKDWVEGGFASEGVLHAFLNSSLQLVPWSSLASRY